MRYNTSSALFAFRCCIFLSSLLVSCGATHEPPHVVNLHGKPSELESYSPNMNIVSDWMSGPITGIQNIIISVIIGAVAMGCCGACCITIAYRLSLCTCDCCCSQNNSSAYSFDHIDPIKNPHLIQQDKTKSKVVPKMEDKNNVKSNSLGVFVQRDKHPVPPDSPSFQHQIPPPRKVKFRDDGPSTPKSNIQISHSASPSSNMGSSAEIEQRRLNSSPEAPRPTGSKDDVVETGSKMSIFSDTTSWTLESDPHLDDYSLPNTLPPLTDSMRNPAVELTHPTTNRSFGEQLRIADQAVRVNNIEHVPKSSDLDKFNRKTNSPTKLSAGRSTSDPTETERVTVIAGESRYSAQVPTHANSSTLVLRSSNNQAISDSNLDRDDELYYSADSLPGLPSGPRLHSESSLGFINLAGVIGSVPPSLKESTEVKLGDR